MFIRLVAGLVTAALALAGLTGCADDASADGRLQVVAGFYPLQYVAEQVGAEHVRVTNLTKPGAEAHDLELAPRSIGQMATSAVVVYLGGFQPAVDEAVEQNAPDAALDVASVARLAPVDVDHDLGSDAHSADDGHDHGVLDPHFWLDPTRLADVADAVATRFATEDPAHAADYRANAARLRTELDQLDADFKAGLRACASNELVTSHAAFGYLADRYGLDLVGISGVDPEQEPSPATMAAVASYVRRHKIATIYTETTASSTLSQTIASETGAATAVLDPLESLTHTTKGDYQSVMRTNLTTLRAGQGCT